MPPLVVVTGTGTEIGKTFLATALVRAWSRLGRRIAAVKPVESGVVGSPADVGALAAAATHVVAEPPPYLLREPVSPHVAARVEGRSIDLDVVTAWVDRVRTGAEGTLVELPGGLFSPLSDTATNADLVRRLAPTRSVLVAPDRLGVLHDVLAVLAATRSTGPTFATVLLSGPERADASTGTNAAELRRLLPATVDIVAIPRTTREDAEALLGPTVRGW